MPFAPLPLSRQVFDARSGSNSFGPLPDWDLTDLYAAPDAPEVQRDLDAVAADVVGFAAEYQGKLADQTAEQLLTCVRRYEAIDITAGRLMSFAGLRYYQNTMDSDRAKFMADMQDNITTHTTPMVFFTL